MFTHAYDNYMTHAFPQDELDPIHCTGRGSDRDRTNININDVLGDYSLGLIDALDTLAVLGNWTEFERAVRWVIHTVNFDRDVTVQVFEANIRVLGGLLSAHLIATGAILPHMRLVDRPNKLDYTDELLWLARDLAVRLLPAFDATPTGLPYPRVNLRHGVPTAAFWRNDTCTAAVGTLSLEFGVLSALTGDPVYAGVAKRALRAIWSRRSPKTGLLGNTMDIHTGRWINVMSGLGAGMDSFFEYLLKAFAMFGDREMLELFETAFPNMLQRSQIANTPIYANIDMNSGQVLNTWIDSLQAYLPGLKVLAGDVEAAAVDHAFYLSIWRRYQALPERFNYRLKVQGEKRQLFESTYMLYRATGSKYYQRVGAELMQDLERHARAPCGYATLHNVEDKSQEDRMESFFLSETLKYLFLLFDDEHPLHQGNATAHVFTTEGHLLPILGALRDAEGIRDTNKENHSAEVAWCVIESVVGERDELKT
ncbi:uncharacterized protein MONBRDRAFT_31742 [Monosiga brevicollis MX1]|uniref:alpha-1,2-Mannosidase n=1 Tax=Monosiga brevicollis TaxID=81824 RepID=A9UUE0_MONBE|nr:uncharacterized protein MONBRDRAFT_31742 [Monosiga brevicollis MX1]EDQ91080.1 predicted protein [Monosiga brevicollis MX1]|eukprot:XP_001744377.1 hypothetical protein [Monosiga brevicollis MX1]